MSRFKTFGFAFVTALLLYLLLMSLSATGYLSKKEDLGSDIFMYLFKQGLVSKKSDYLYAFVDVDEMTFSSWGEPLLMPRDKLLCLINFARASKAKLIVVDFDLSYQDLDREAEVALANSLARMGENAPCSVLPAASSAEASASNVPIILYRTISHYHVSPISKIGKLRLSFLEDIVSQSDHLFWASATLQIDPDGIVRHWMLWKEACLEPDDRVEVIPSIALAAQTLLKGDDPDRVARVLKRACARLSCTDASRYELCPKLDIRDRRLDLSKQETRILYTIAWLPIRDIPPDSGEWWLEDGQPPVVEYRGRKEPIIVPIRAGNVTQLYCPEGSEQPSTSQCQRMPLEHEKRDQNSSTEDRMAVPNILEDRIVIIGGSHSASRDIYATPVRETMPGAVIIINSIHTLMAYGALHPPGWLIGFVTFLIQAGILAAVYCYMRGALYVTVAYVILLGVSFVLNGILLKSGVWIDASLATMGVFMYGQFARMVVKITQFSRRVWNRVASCGIVLWVLVAVSVVAMPRLALAQDSASGYVETFNKPSSMYELRRHRAKKLTVYHFAPLYPGDQIVVKKSADSDAFIRLRQVDGRAITIHRQQSPYKISNPVGRSTWIEFFVRSGKELTTWWDKSPTFREAVTRGKRLLGDEGGALSVDILDHRHLAVVEGRRNFTLAWHGGAAPFKVRLIRIGKLSAEFVREELMERRLPPEQVTLEPGVYRVEVRDSGQSKPGIGQFEVVPKGDLPSLPAEAQTTELPPEVLRTNDALWLAGQGSGRWALESYLRIDDLADRYDLARILQGMLAKGSIPVPEG